MTPNGNPCSSSVARASRTGSPSSGAARARLLEQPRLPDPRGALDDQGSAVALARGAQRGADALDLVLALEQRVRPGNRGPVHAPADRKRARAAPRNVRGSMSGVRPMCAAPLIRRTMADKQSDPTKEDSVPLIQVKLIEGVFTAPQKREIVERLTDAMVEIEGESMRRIDLVHGRGGRQRRVGHRRPGPDGRRGQGARIQRP